MRTCIVFLMMILSGCSTNEAIKHRRAHRKFVYVADLANEIRVYDSIDEPFYGDCEDYAFTLQRQIGGHVMYVQLDDGQPHAVLMKDGVIYENRYPNPYPVWKIDGRILAEMILTESEEITINTAIEGL